MGKATEQGLKITKPTLEQLRGGDFEKRTVGHAEGAQTHSQAYVRKQTRSALDYMHERGSITAEQLRSAREIALVAEYIERSVAARCASMEARVDCSRSPTAQVNESLRMVRLESAYSEWRSGINQPARMVIDMVTEDTDMRGIAKRYRKSWDRTARHVLKDELDRWPEIAKRYAASVRYEDLVIMHARLSV